MGRIQAFKNIDTFGERLKFVRLYFQITQSDLAHLIDLHQGTLTKIERNVFLPEQNVIKKISDTFSLNPLYLRHGQAPIFTKRLVFGDFFVTDRNSKLQNLLSGESISKIVLYLLGAEPVHEVHGISGKSIYDIFIFGSFLSYPHYLVIRTDIEVGTSIKKILEQEDLKTYYVENSALLSAFDLLYYNEYKSPRYDNFRKTLQQIGIPQHLRFLLEFSEDQILVPLTFSQEDADKVKNLLEFFMATKANEKQIQAAMKRLRETRESSAETAEELH